MGLQDLSLRHCETDLGLVSVLSLIPECKGTVALCWETHLFCPLGELKPGFGMRVGELTPSVWAWGEAQP